MIRALTPDDFETYREIRLRALRSDPGAFASSLERELEFDAAKWRERLSDFNGEPTCAFLAEVDGASVGLAGVGRYDDGSAELMGMWVDPAARGSSVAGDLVASVVEWCEANDCHRLEAWVSVGNDHAARFYEKLGFLRTGKTDAHTSGQTFFETEIVIDRNLQ